MKPEISALLDNELDQSEASRTIDALKRNRELQEAWSVYHLIGDALRGSSEYSPNLPAKVMKRLADEPVVFVPSAQRKKSNPLRYALSLAAAVMGMAAVAWVALSLNPPQPVELAAKPGRANEPAMAVAEASPPAVPKEYLVAHQAHSPGSGFQGIATYVRTVSEIRKDGRQ